MLEAKRHASSLLSLMRMHYWMSNWPRREVEHDWDRRGTETQIFNTTLTIWSVQHRGKSSVLSMFLTVGRSRGGWHYWQRRLLFVCWQNEEMAVCLLNLDPLLILMLCPQKMGSVQRKWPPSEPPSENTGSKRWIKMELFLCFGKDSEPRIVLHRMIERQTSRIALLTYGFRVVRWISLPCC